MEVPIDHKWWAKEVFGRSTLGDRRRTNRLVDYAARQAAKSSSSTHAVCEGDSAAAEGAYRLLRNPEVKPEAMAESGYGLTVRLCGEADVVLAIQDSTTMAYGHSVSEELGDLGGKSWSKKRGYWVHSTLALDGQDGEVLGLLDQHWWVRRSRRKRRGENKSMPYEQKESFKWQRAVEAVAKRMTRMEKVVMVGDREADVHEYLEFMDRGGYRYVVRAERNRRVQSEAGYLWETVESQAVAFRREVTIPQKGGRPERLAEVEVRFCEVELRPPVKHAHRGSMRLWAVLLKEMETKGGLGEGLEWMLLTSEKIDTEERAWQVVTWYRRRWAIEDFHKAWKTGCGAEARRFHKPETMRRVLTILAFVAARLLQLRHLSLNEPEAPCDRVLTKEQWVCLVVLSKEGRGRPLPDSVPSIRWAVEHIAQLGGWIKSKQTMAIGWQTLWKGWQRLDERVIGFLAAQEMAHACKV